MKLLKYQASNMREALSQIKDELGDKAMVVSTRDVRRGLLGKGVEVSVALEVDNPEPEAPTKALQRRSEPSPTGAAYSLRESDIERIMGPLRSELRSLRSLLRATSESRQAEELRREMSETRKALTELREHPHAVEDLSSLVQDTRIAAPSDSRIVTLVGPTGVGKTTTIAKLAANAVYKEQKSAAIVTLDTYRVGGEEQMRTYANLIGAPLFVVADPRNLVSQIGELEGYDKVYIDTAGRSPRDVPAIRTLRSALSGVTDMEVHLTLALTTPANVMDANHHRYSSIGLNRLLFTKLDESLDFQELVRAPARLEVPVSFVTTGQAVPEDVEAVTEASLMGYAERGVTSLTEAA